MKRKITILLFALISVNGFGQIMFQERINQNPLNYLPFVGVSGQQTSDGGYIVGGWAEIASSPYPNLLITKINSVGAIQWSNLLGNDSTDLSFNSVIQTSDGGYIAGGYDSPYGFLIRKYYNNGGISWSHAYKATNSNGGDGCNSIVQSSDGGYILSGYFYDVGNMMGMLLIKIDSWGSVSWSKNMYGLGGGSSVKQTFDGGYIVKTSSFISGCVLIKFDSNGNILWEKSYGGINSGSVIQTLDSCYVIVGSAYISNNHSDISLIKTNSVGDTLWTKTYGGDSLDIGCSVIQTSDGGFAIGAYTLSFGAVNKDVYLIKTDSSGNLAWSKQYLIGNNSLDIVTVKQTTDGGYFLLADADMYLIKTDNNGNSGCNETSPATAVRHFNIPISIPNTSELSGVIITSPNLISSSAGTVNQICTTVDISENKNSESATISISPNPFTSTTTISFSEEQKNTKLKVINVLGEEVFQSTINGKQYTLEMSGITKGIYFVRIEDASPTGNVVNRKIVVQ